MLAICTTAELAPCFQIRALPTSWVPSLPPIPLPYRHEVVSSTGRVLETRTETPILPKSSFFSDDCRCNSGFLNRITDTIMPHKTIIRLSGVARNPANGFPARLLVLQRQFREGCGVMPAWRRGAWHGSVWPVRYCPAYPQATAATRLARTVPGAAFPAPPGRPAAS